MLSGMGCGAHGLGIDGEVVLESSLAKIVPKSNGGWKDGLGQFDWVNLVGTGKSAAGGADGSKVGITWAARVLSAGGSLRVWLSWSTALFGWG